MSAKRRQRLLHLRAIEHRIAAADLARADAALANVAAVEARIARLRDGIETSIGSASGRELQSLAELAARLDRARAGLEVSRANADAERSAREEQRHLAYRAEEQAERLHSRALAAETAAREQRIAAARIWRPIKRETSC